MAPDELPNEDIITLPERSPRAWGRWRRPLVGSLLVHALGAGLAWWGLASVVPTRSAVVTVDLSLVTDDKDDDLSTMDVEVSLTPPVPHPPVVIAPSRPAAAPVVEPQHAAPTPAPPAVATGSTGAGEPGSSSGSGNAAAGPATTFFAVPAQGRSVVYVIDRSGSMGKDSRLAFARREVLASLSRLPESAHFQIVAYNNHIEMPLSAGRIELLPATQANKERAAQFLEGLAAEGSTSHEKALDQALRLTPDVIYFLTDADDLKADQVRALTQLNRGRAAIHAIELNTINRDRNEMPMHALPRLNHGQYQAVDVLRLR